MSSIWNPQDRYILANGAVSANSPLSGDGSNSQPLGLDLKTDNSLSGNGTLTSPLGVVPGYNETVLWSGVYSGSISDSNFITLSERPDNFETIEITNGPGYYSKYRYDGNSDSWSFMQTFANNGATTVYTNRYSVDEKYPRRNL